MPKNIFYSDLTFDHDRYFKKGFSFDAPLYVKFFSKCCDGGSIHHRAMI